MRSTGVLVLAVAMLAAGAGFFAYRATPSNPPDAEAGAELMRLRLLDTAGNEQSLAQWRNKVLIVNFWVTWCEPCREEVPVLLRVQAKYAANGVQVVGIAVDSVDKVREFANEYRIEYPLVIGSIAVIEVTRRLGNKAAGLPYTVVMDRSGRVVKSHLGAISEAELERAIRLASG
jgi:thiol-disulfide isomerase/thioredoxin